MKTQDDPPTKIAELPLTAFELPKWLARRRHCHDHRRRQLGAGKRGLGARAAFRPGPASARPSWPARRAAFEPAVRSCRLFNTALDFMFYNVPTRIIDFDALSDPEGSLLPIDATSASASCVWLIASILRRMRTRLPTCLSTGFIKRIFADGGYAGEKMALVV
jgi:hypothetical protein